MLTLRILLCVFILFLGRILAEDTVDDEPEATLFLYKYTPTNPVVEGRDFIVSYNIINTGSAVAGKIELSDFYDPKHFELGNNVKEDGIVTFTLDDLAPGAQTTYNVTVKPKLDGIYEGGRARIKYTSGAVSIDDVPDDMRQGFSTMGRIKIISSAEHHRNTSYNIPQWSFYIICNLVLVGIPFYSWRKASQVRREKSQIKKSS